MKSPLAYLLIGCVLGFVVTSCCAATMTGLYFATATADITVSTSNSGIYGTVLSYPSCPVERLDYDYVCQHKPMSVDMLVKNRQGIVVSRFVPDVEGDFSLPLASGTYYISPARSSSAPPTFIDPGKVIVRAGEYTKVDVYFDSGVR